MPNKEPNYPKALFRASCILVGFSFISSIVGLGAITVVWIGNAGANQTLSNVTTISVCLTVVFGISALFLGLVMLISVSRHGETTNFDPQGLDEINGEDAAPKSSDQTYGSSPAGSDTKTKDFASKSFKLSYDYEEKESVSGDTLQKKQDKSS